MLQAALSLAEEGFQVFSLHGKTPWRNCDECQAARAGCACNHLLCHAFHAATRDPARIKAMWAAKPEGNIGIRPMPNHFVLDLDPRNAGALPEGLPPTRTAISGRGDGGKHLYFIGDRPRGLGVGIDIKNWTGYVVAPPSLHPDTGQPYRWENELPIAHWPSNVRPAPGAKQRMFTDTRPEWMGRFETIPGTWDGVLLPEGWTTNGQGDWLHPTATSQLSARVIDDLLYVFSSSTVFTQTAGGAPRGYNRMEAHALLNGLDLDTVEGWLATINALEG